MTDLPTLKALQTRIREATGPSRELDYLIAETFFPPYNFYVVHKSDTPRFTTYPEGLGACVQLMREVLPEAKYKRTEDGLYFIRGRGGPGGCWGQLIGVTEPLANDCLTFLDAIIAAKIAQLEAQTEKV